MDPQGGPFGLNWVFRGGSCWYPARGSRASYRADFSQRGPQPGGLPPVEDELARTLWRSGLNRPRNS